MDSGEINPCALCQWKYTPILENNLAILIMSFKLLKPFDLGIFLLGM